MTRRRILLIDRASDGSWDSNEHRFSQIASALQATDVTCARIRSPLESAHRDRSIGDRSIGDGSMILIDRPPMALICARGRALETDALRDAYSIAHWARGKEFDLIVAPLRGGLAFGLLMMRATGEHAGIGRVAVWCDRSSRQRLFDDETSVGHLAPLVCDAMERTTLKLADALLVPHNAGFKMLPGISAPTCVVNARLPAIPITAQTLNPGQELIFVGELSRSNRVFQFLDAIESLARDQRLPGACVTFLGPERDHSSVVKQDLLGIRAMAWPFRFKVQHSKGYEEALQYVTRHGHLAIFAGDEDDDRLRLAAVAAGCRVLKSDSLNGANRQRQGAAGFADAILETWNRAPDIERDQEPTSWPDLVARLCELPFISVDASQETITVCIVSRGQKSLVDRALASIDTQSAEIIIVDNCGPQPIECSSAHSRQRQPKVIRLETAVPAPAAYNRAAAEATGTILVLLDDDNTFARNGLTRLTNAVAHGQFDVVVSTLDLVDGNPAIDPSSGHSMFLGDPEMAGLFFNGFGDTAMAIRREAFLAIGGFVDEGYKMPAFDWILLAKARAAGLRIGVLIDPAVRYARSLGGEANNWMKNDGEGARRAVHDAYGQAIDGPLMARLAQGLIHELG